MSAVRPALVRVLGSRRGVRAVTVALSDRLLVRSPVPPPGLRAGGERPGPVTDGWPVVVLLCSGADRPGAERLVESLAGLSRAAGGCRFVLVLPSDLLAVARRASYPVESLVDRATWARRHPGVRWAEHVRDRVEQMTRDYVPAAVLSVDLDSSDEGSDALTGLVLAAVAGHRPRRWQRALLALRRSVDVPGTG